MNIVLYPTAAGCFRPAEVEELARAWLDAGQSVAVASTDVALTRLEGAVCLKNEHDWTRIGDIRPDCFVVDAADFSDPDGQETIIRPGYPVVPFSFPAVRFRQILDELDRQGAREVLIAMVNSEISSAWHTKLQAWGVEIRWHAADSARWRNWKVSSPDHHDPIQPGELLDDGRYAIGAWIHSPRSQLLLTLVAEYSDIHLAGHDRVPPDDPVRILVRMLAGMPIADRLRLTSQLLDDLRLMSLQAEGLHRSLQGAGRGSRTPSARAFYLNKPTFH